MGLPNIGPLELIIVLAIALLVVGPKRLPEMGSAFGRTIREFRKSTAGLSDPLGTDPEPDKPSEQVAANVEPPAAASTAPPPTATQTAVSEPAAAPVSEPAPSAAADSDPKTDTAKQA